MNDRFAAIGAFLFAVVVIVFGVLALRWFNSVASVVEVVQPKPGIECVVVTTTDGVAVDCNWMDAALTHNYGWLDLESLEDVIL